MKMADVIYSSALCVVLNKYVLAVTSCGMDHQLKSVMLTNTLGQVEMQRALYYILY